MEIEYYKCPNAACTHTVWILTTTTTITTTSTKQQQQQRAG
jgi:hypothetical protein